MDWHFEERADLQHPAGALSWPDLMMVQGDHQAHQWRVRVFDAGEPVDLTGYTITGYFDRSDGMMVPVVGTASGNVASVTLPQSVYAATGPLLGLLRAGKNGSVMTLAAGRWNVRRGPGDEIVDPGHVVPSLAELLEKIAEMERKTTAANNAASAANTAAANAKKTADDAAAAAAKTASEAASAATKTASDAAAAAKKTADDAAASVDSKIADAVAELHAHGVFVDNDGNFYVEMEE